MFLKMLTLSLQRLVAFVCAAFLSLSAIAQSELPPSALPAGGLEPDGAEVVLLDELDISLGANSVILNYFFTNPSSDEVQQGLIFRLPRLSYAAVQADAQLRSLRRLNFIDARIRRNGRRFDFESRLRLFYGEEDVTARLASFISGQTISDILEQIPLDDLIPADIEPDRNLLSLGLEFFWTETFPPVSGRQIALIYRPYAGFFRLDTLSSNRFTSSQIGSWRSALNQAFCLSHPENADLSSALANLPAASGQNTLLNGLPASPGLLQSAVLDLSRHHRWQNSLGQFTLTVDPHLYSERGARIPGSRSFTAFCGRQSEAFDPEGVIRLTRSNTVLNEMTAVLFLHDTAGNDELENQLIVQNLFDGSDCRPHNGLLVPCSDMRQLAPDEVAAFSAEALAVAQLEILARRGARFTDVATRRHFERFDWYEPYTTSPVLSAVERGNILLFERVRLEKLNGTAATIVAPAARSGSGIEVRTLAPVPPVADVASPQPAAAGSPSTPQAPAAPENQ